MAHFRHRLFWHLHIGMLTLAISSAANAQHGTAPNNYYPDWYTGSTFTGLVVSATPSTITLVHTRGDKSETFGGFVNAPCNLPSSKVTTAPMPLTSVQPGTVIMAFYEPRTIRVDGENKKENQIMAISFIAVNGRKVIEATRKIFYCIPAPFHTYFRAFAGN